MSIQHFSVQYRPTAPLVDQNGIPIRGYGAQFFKQLYNRTGQGNGIIPGVSGPLTAIGNSLATALQLVNDWNDVEGGGANTGVIIPAALQLAPGNFIWVFNGTNTNKNVYPPDVNTQIDALGNGNPYPLPSAKLRCFQAWPVQSVAGGVIAGALVFRSYGN